MYSLLINKRPHSHQGGDKIAKTSRLRAELEQILTKYYPNYSGYCNSDLYGIIYYFHRRTTNQDADNLSKPVWDSLQSVLYRDDSCIKLRIAGTFDTSKNDFQTLDVTGLPTDVIIDLTTAIAVEEHVVYIECGRMRNDLFRFNIE
jgi:hypothetical protein